MEKVSNKRLMFLSVTLLGVLSLTSTIPRLVIAQNNPSPSFSKSEQYEAQQLQQAVRRLESQGKYGEAIPLAQRALELWEKAIGSENSVVADSLDTLAILHSERGNYNQAESLFQRALAIYDKLENRRENLPVVARILNNLAGLYQNQGNYNQAEPLLKRALTIFEKLKGQEDTETRNVLSNLATLYLEQGKYSQAEPLLKRDLAIREKGPKLYTLDIANSLNNLGSLYRRQGKYSQAEPLLKRALVLVEKTRGQEHPYGAFVLNNLALIYQAQGKYSQAKSLLQRTITIREKALGQNHPLIVKNLITLSGLYQAQGDIPHAIEFLSRSSNIEERNLFLTFTTRAEAQKSAYIAPLSGVTNTAISLHIQAAPDNPQAARLALTTILQHKNRGLNTSINNLQTRLRLNVENKTLLEIATARSNLAISTFNKPETNAQSQSWRRLTALIDSHQKLESLVNRSTTELEIQNQPITIESVQKLIPIDAALVELALYQPFNPKAVKESEAFGSPRYVAYILHNQGNPQGVDLGEAITINEAVTKFRNTIRTKSGSQTSFKTAARNLDTILMQPIRKQLGSKRNILLSPDSQLNLIPFAALIDEKNQYLLENYEITYLSSGRDLIRLQADVPSKETP